MLMTGGMMWMMMGGRGGGSQNDGPSSLVSGVVG